MTAVEVLDGDHHLFGVHDVDVVRVHGDCRRAASPLALGAPIALADVIIEPIWALSTNDRIHDVMPQEYPPHGRFRYNEQCLMVRFP